MLPDLSYLEKVTHRVVQDIVSYGFPFMESLGTIEGIVTEMERPMHCLMNIRQYNLAVPYMLSSRSEDAKARLAEIREPKGNPDRLKADQTFARSFAAYYYGSDPDA